jgi:hypothetical protein
MLVLAGVSLWAAQAGFPDSLAELPLWGLLSFGFLAASLFLLANVCSPEEQADAVITQRRLADA